MEEDEGVKGIREEKENLHGLNFPIENPVFILNTQKIVSHQ